MKGVINMNNRKKYEYELKRINYLSMDLEYDYLPTQEEQDLYILSDDRFWTSNIEDIDGGDNFADYFKEFFDMLNEEEYYDD